MAPERSYDQRLSEAVESYYADMQDNGVLLTPDAVFFVADTFDVEVGDIEDIISEVEETKHDSEEYYAQFHPVYG